MQPVSRINTLIHFLPCTTGITTDSWIKYMKLNITEDIHMNKFPFLVFVIYQALYYQVSFRLTPD